MVRFTVFLQNIIGENPITPIGINAIKSFIWGWKFPMQILLILKLVTWIIRADQQMIGFKVTSVWTVLYTLLRYIDNWQYTFFGHEIR